jgi:3-hydroxybutyryl-CoA dehydrogenase
MRIVVITNDLLKEELAGAGVSQDVQITWQENPTIEGNVEKVEAVIDLLFQNDPSRIELLKQMADAVIINSVADTLTETDPSFARINGWPGMLRPARVEAAATNDVTKQKVEQVLSFFQRQIEWLPDEPGFVTPRVISMIINEAYLSLEEGVSSKEHINTAMKLGTNYPFGPFEWAEMIGLEKITALLQKLSLSHPRYQHARLLQDI